MKRKLTTFILLLTLLFLPTSNAYAQEPGGDVFMMGQNYTLGSDETLNGNLAVIGGNALIEEDAIVNGDIVVIGGNLTINGHVSGNVAIIGGNLTISGKIDGDIAVIGGQASLTKTAVVNGGITTIGGQVEKDPGAEVSGEIVNNNPLTDIPQAPNVPNVPGVPNVPNTPNGDISFNPFWKAAGVFGRALAVAAIGMLLTLFMQPQLERVADAIIRQPVMAGSFGLLTFVIAFMMVITLILIPVAFIVVFVIPLAWLLGIIALGQEVGERFTTAINQTWAPVLATGFGTFLLMLVGGFIGLIPCLGWLLTFLIGLVAIGGVAMTWFGTRSSPGTMMTPQAEVPPAS